MIFLGLMVSAPKARRDCTPADIYQARRRSAQISACTSWATCHYTHKYAQMLMRVSRRLWAVRPRHKLRLSQRSHEKSMQSLVYRSLPFFTAAMYEYVQKALLLLHYTVRNLGRRLVPIQYCRIKTARVFSRPATSCPQRQIPDHYESHILIKDITAPQALVAKRS